jgi:hypothetical protein
MPRPDARELRTALVPSLGFLAFGTFALWAGAPRLVSWMSLMLGGAGLITVVWTLPVNWMLHATLMAFLGPEYARQLA